MSNEDRPGYVGLGRTAAVNEAPKPIDPRGRPMLYPHNALEGFGNGCILDLRVRLALNFLQHSPRYAAVSGDDGVDIFSPSHAASDALDLATALLAESERRELIAPIDLTGELDESIRAQAKRLARFQVLQQIEAQKAAQAEQSRVVPMAPGFAGKPN
jgi:hypothetical protein